MSAAPLVPEVSQRTLGLFAKWPQPGEVKTRLASATSPAWAAEVAAAFLADIVDRFATVHARRVLAYAPPAAEGYFAELTQGRFALTVQREGDLGRRMADFFTEQLQAGADRVVLLGTDSPTVPLAFIEQAFQELERADIVLGPAMDGGYYLIGCARRRDVLPPVFEGVAWSGSRVLADTMARLTDPSWRVALLPPWYDVDTLDDWWMLRGDLRALRRSGHDPGVPRTERLAEAVSVT
jgi:rSAM/selenodomain-associated transferase 1